jgi:LysM repeat protein
MLGNEASADSSTSVSDQTLKNSQNMNLLEANVSLASVVSSGTQGSGGSKIDPTESVNIMSDNALLPATSLMDASGASSIEDFSSLEDDTNIYVVHEGDTVEIVAKLFDVTPDTIYSANDMKKGDKLKKGDILLVLPFSGVEHTIVKGETLKGIASKYKVELEDILNANDIEIEGKLTVGDKLLVPGADILTPKSSNIAKGGTYLSMPSAAGYFINPVPGSRKSRGVKPGHKGVDMAAPTGTPIYAAAGGTVMIARMGWNGGYGNYVVIQHPKGFSTLYAHMSKLGTTPGAKVSQGQLIGYVGSTGHSTGPHLHFQTMGVKNPF